MTNEEFEREIRDELDAIQSKLDQIEHELENLNNTVSENAQSANNIKSDI
ncbi:MAG: hypothetical protein IJF70_00250 [Opitutales bacterium]|nr:hypothetical protein [Opitutales bacterium]